MIYSFKYIILVLIFVFPVGIGHAQSVESAHLISIDQLLSFPKDNYVAVHLATPEDYLKGHIPDAVNISRADISGSTLKYDGIMASRWQIQKLLGSLGISQDDNIYIYDDNGGCDAARLWWILHCYGHRNSAIIDGGLQGWKDTPQLQISSTRPTIEPTIYYFSRDRDNHLFASLTDVQSAIKDTNTIILDVRSLDEYTGEVRKNGAFRKGRIPTSIHSDWANVIHYSSDKKFKPIDEIKALFKRKGVSKDKKIIVYCQSGVRSAHTTFVLSEILGYENVQNYDGSWTEWSFNKTLPIESGTVNPKDEKEEETEDPDYGWLFVIPIAIALFVINRRRLRK